MKKETIPGNLVSLASDQIGEALAKRFWKALKSGRKLHRDHLGSDEKIIPDELKRNRIFGRPRVAFTGKVAKRKSKRPTEKGHVSIRSQTGHDHDRHHQK